MQKKKLPIGIEFFKDLREENFYYVDKTEIIRDLLNEWAKVNLFTRPRRFGKTLTMTTLKAFFEIGTDPTLFDGLAISKETELCKAYLGKFPVIFLSLKDIDGASFEDACDALRSALRYEISKFRFLTDDPGITGESRNFLNRFLDGAETKSDIPGSLKILSSLLYQHYGQKVILLIDEYDVPLDKAFVHGYYDEMVTLIRSLFSQALKTNDALQFAVLTGCLRISKESIFTGLNNFKIFSIDDDRLGEHFGFTESEVRQLLKDYHLEDRLDEAREWYDGYCFGSAHIYCPWDMINYVDFVSANPHRAPQSFWINSSGNDLVRRFIDKADKSTQNEIERLINGECVEKAIRLDLTYNDLDTTIDNLWSVLFATGYLTHRGMPTGGIYKLCIPNHEVREIFVLQIQEWFKTRVTSGEMQINTFYKAFLNGDAKMVQDSLNIILSQMISILDTKAPDNQKENFYHGLLLGLLRAQGHWLILSNAESGDGFSDIIVEPEDPEAGIVIEVKYAPTVAALEQTGRKALNQIKEKHYIQRLINDDRTDLMIYGMAFCRKRCRVICEKI